MLIKLNVNRLKINILFIIFIFINSSTYLYSEIMILSGCKNLKDGFIKNEYILDLEKSLMTRNYIFDRKTFKKYRVTDLSVKKKNSIQRFIYKEDNLFLTDKMGYPQFYTQLIFKKKSPTIQIKTVINNQAGITKISTCKKVEIFKKES